jgi:outer membrane receptor for ferrienterochelin and colicin
MKAIRFIDAVGLALVTACASTGAGPGTHRDANVLTQEEIDASHEAYLYEAIAKMRPLFLKSRGRSTISSVPNDYATVFLDGQRYGSLNSLRTIVASSVYDARYLSGTDAVTRYGMQYGGGVIEVRTHP